MGGEEDGRRPSGEDRLALRQIAALVERLARFVDDTGTGDKIAGHGRPDHLPGHFENLPP